MLLLLGNFRGSLTVVEYISVFLQDIMAMHAKNTHVVLANKWDDGFIVMKILVVKR